MHCRPTFHLLVELEHDNDEFIALTIFFTSARYATLLLLIR